ncbi:electron transfer flavoprotein subunit alpha/FixB family protein [Chlorobium ferrooxidans]|uniref:Electron transfer flavoprotein beta-subunit:Electron transfer flavoprotein, alpha subunit n=1 Tax=Chlorobium ferrooxidans DSM 13031 TaxID=377431 RepID=Q0YSM0_9CHLB|nr:electron transfer flavoprotein subunit alpha/FixB family protein [Chlorobium ferrooxidans]EAT59179.1 Electron transfer flavoprotein beta-subunit:Electron transfer flavoprotein, alpha subunit [Chlorobium ferrooxidans DSM 13031]
MTKFLVFLEQREGVLKKSSIDAWNRVQEIAALSAGAIVTGLLAGPVDRQRIGDLLAGDGVVYHANEERLRPYQQESYTRLVTSLVKQESISALFFADSSLSRDLAPRLSVLLKASLLSGDLLFNRQGYPDGSFRPVYSGLATASFSPQRNISIYTLSPSRGMVIRSSADGTVQVMPTAQYHHSSDNLLAEVRRIVLRQNSLDIAEAGIIVAGGRGMGSSAGFALLEELAALLGGAVGASRFAVDEGWRPHAEQIGQTGKTVAPQLYFACGVSGAPQHLAGIASAGIVVAINSDPDASIFQVADFGIVGDVHLVLPKLIEALKEFLKKK